MARARLSSSKARAIACSLIVGLVIGITTAASLMTVGVREVSLIASLGAFIPVLSVVMAALIALASYALLRNTPRIVAWAGAFNPLRKLALTFNKRDIAIASLVIFVCWIPWIVLQYPTSMNGDTYNQLYQFQTSSPTLYTTLNITVDESFIDHHPVFDTLLYGAFLSLGDAIGSQNIGLFIFALLQSAFTALGMGMACCYIEKLGVPKMFRLLSLAFFALFPPIPLWAASIVKDTVFVCVFLYYSLLVIEAVRTRGAMFESRGLIAAYIIVGCLCILAKKTGAIVIVVTTIALALYLRDSFRALAAGAIVPLVVCFALVPALVYPAIGGVAPGGKQEMFGFALQQVVTAINENDDLSSDERARLDRVLDVAKAQKRYEPDIVDPVKNSVIKTASTQDYLDFVPAYFSIGLRHPVAYTYSVFSVTGPLITPGRAINHYVTLEQDPALVEKLAKADEKGELHLVFDKPEPIDGIAHAFDSFSKKVSSRLQPFDFLATTGFYGGWLPMACLIMCLFYDRRSFVAMVPQLAVFALLFVCPASSVRYTLPLMFTAPIMLGLLCQALTQPSANGKSPRHHREHHHRKIGRHANNAPAKSREMRLGKRVFIPAWRGDIIAPYDLTWGD